MQTALLLRSALSITRWSGGQGAVDVLRTVGRLIVNAAPLGVPPHAKKSECRFTSNPSPLLIEPDFKLYGA